MAEEAITIYTDGGCSGNPGPGGWAFVILDGDRRRERSGGDPATTNNRMELTAVIEALQTLRTEGLASNGRLVKIYTDSQYVKNGIGSWIHNWERNGWITSAKKPVKNVEYWKRLKGLTDSFNLEWHWVRGHAGDELNERCDKMVQDEMKRLK